MEKTHKKLLCLATDFDRILIFYNELQNNSKTKRNEQGDINSPIKLSSLTVWVLQFFMLFNL